MTQFTKGQRVKCVNARDSMSFLEDALAELRRLAAKAEPAPVQKADPYAAHRVRVSDSYARTMTDGTTPALEARKRNIAALASELRRPVSPRFPSEARSCRVYERNRSK